MFLKGTSHECTMMINVVASGNFLNKTIAKVKKIIEDLAISEQNLDYGRATLQKGIYKLNSLDNLLVIE